MIRRRKFILALCFGILLFSSYVPLASLEIDVSDIHKYSFNKALGKTSPTFGIVSASHLKEPNDPFYSLQWGLNNRGTNIPQQLGIIDADIDAPQAWEHTTRSDIIVAIINSGADLGHQDLDDNIWYNFGELPGDGLDNDGNGFVDDWNGMDFVYGWFDGLNWHNDADGPMDDDGHGTHVAGIIGAEGNNGIGVAGVNWDIELMILKNDWNFVLGAEAIYYAVDNGAKIINLSWGAYQGETTQTTLLTLYQAIAYANRMGVLVVVAAGNDGNDNDWNEDTEDINGNGVLNPGEDLDQDGRLDVGEDLDGDGHLDSPSEDLNGNGWEDPGEDLDGDGRFDFIDEDTNGNGRLDGTGDGNGNGRIDRHSYPDGFDNPNIIAVAASDNRDILADFSNYGIRSVDIAAPGVDIYSTTPTYTVPDYALNYDYASGTSMAAPHVSGAAAHFWTLFPWLTHLEVKNWLLHPHRVDSRPGIMTDNPPVGNFPGPEDMGVASGLHNDGRLRMISGDDFGDAPDPWTGVHTYPTSTRYEGASHEDIGEEWLGGCNYTDVSPEFDANVLPPWDVDGHGNLLPHRIPPTPEPPYMASPIPDLDLHDDGIIPIGPWVPGQWALILYSIRTENEDIVDSEGGRYGGVNPLGVKLLYINIWIDWNNDGDWWDANEHVFNAAHNPTAEWNGTHCSGWIPIFIQVPPVPPNIVVFPTWLRARLDYGENAGAILRYDGHPWHVATRGLAQYGEVEDYLIPSPRRIYVINSYDTSIVQDVTITWESGSITKYAVSVPAYGVADIVMQLPGVDAETVLQITVNASGRDLGVFVVGATWLGDINGDGVVDGLDLYYEGVGWGSAAGDPNWNWDADINADAAVDGLDLYWLGVNWGRSL